VTIQRDGSEPGKHRTILDIAAEAGVSKTTVSRVLNGAHRVAPETRARVLDAIERSGYQVNRAARTLRTTRTAIVGLLVPQIDNEVFGQIAERLDEGLRASEVDLMVTSSGWDADNELRALEALESRGVEAVAAALVNDRDPRVAARLRELRCPLVLLDREVRGVTCDAVLIDQRPGLHQALEHLAGLGHRSVGLLSMTDRTRPGREMVAAYREGVNRHNLRDDPDLISLSDFGDHQAGMRSADQLLGAGASAVIMIGSIALVAGLFERLDATGVRVPEDLSVVLYTDSPLASMKRPRLSVIARPVDEVGRLAARLVLGRIERGDTAPTRIEVVRTRLVDRESTAPAP
jgi:LacI family transcriptional regulator